jgi:antitoxin component YwqK of YwqJK toxin-antitoxin module
MKSLAIHLLIKQLRLTNFAAMKKVFWLCFLIVSSLCTMQAVAQEQFNQVDDQGLKKGAWQVTYPDGNLRYTGQFKEGKPFDVFKYYFKTGELKTVLTYDEEVENRAYAVHYYQTGEKMAEGWYFNKEKDSLWKTFGANEVLLSEGKYYEGKKYGRWRTFYQNGRLAEEKYFDKDIEVGELKVYFDNGKLRQTGFYKNGFLDGPTVFFNPEGDTLIKGFYYKGSRDQNWTYFKNKKIDRVLQYEKGKLLNPEELPSIPESEKEDSLKQNIKDELEFEDLNGTIKYE